MNWFLSLFQHRHEWVDTASHPRMVGTEQRCLKCGEYRHDLFDHIHSNARNWRPGRHPRLTTPNARMYNPTHDFDECLKRKPPLGLMSRQLWENQRVIEIIEAMGRYKAAGKQIPHEWDEELESLTLK